MLQKHFMEIFLGGPNLSIFDGCLIVEELSWGCTGINSAIRTTGLGVSKRSYTSV